MSITDLNCSGVSRVAGTAVPTPALLTRMSTLPNMRIVASTSSRHSSGLVTSVRTTRAPRPVFSTSLRVPVNRSSRRAASATSAPASASATAKATPIPLDAPVTIATRPSTRKRSRIVIARFPSLRQTSGRPNSSDTPTEAVTASTRADTVRSTASKARREPGVSVIAGARVDTGLVRRRGVGRWLGRLVLPNPALFLLGPGVGRTHPLNGPLIPGCVVDVNLPIKSAVTDKRVNRLVHEFQHQLSEFVRHRVRDVVDGEPHEVVSRYAADEQGILWHVVNDDHHVKTRHHHLGKPAGLRGVDVGDGFREGTFVVFRIGTFGAVHVPQWHAVS